MGISEAEQVLVWKGGKLETPCMLLWAPVQKGKDRNITNKSFVLLNFHFFLLSASLFHLIPEIDYSTTVEILQSEDF